MKDEPTSRRKASEAASPAEMASPAVPEKRAPWRRLPLPSLGREKLLSYSLIALAVAFNLVYLYPELGIGIPSLNDNAFHYLLVQTASDALANGENLVDHWSPTLELGFPQFLYYQHLPHIAVVLLDRLLLEQVGLLTLFNLTRYILLVALPLTVYWSMRRMGFAVIAAGFAAAAATLLSANHRYGLEYDSYVWRGFGMYTQVWAVHLSFITLACLHGLLEKGKGYLPAVLACSLLMLSHLLYAYMIGISAVVLFASGLNRQNFRARSVRFALALGLTAVVTAYMWIPFMTTKEYVGISEYLQVWKYDSFGAGDILRWLVEGDLLDHGRLPVFTLLLAVGVVAALLNRKQPARLALGLFVVWMALYFGRPTWGSLADLLPLHEGLFMHRFIGGVHLAAILLIGLGGEFLWRHLPRLVHAARRLPVLRALPRYSGAIAAGLVLLALLAPALAERRDYYGLNEQWMERTETALDADADARAVLDTLAQQPPGRTYAGLREGWGNEMKFGDLRFTDLLTFNQVPAVSPPYQGLSLNAELMWHFDDTNPAHYGLFNVKYVIAPAAQAMPDFLAVIKETPRYTLYRADTTGYATFAAVLDRRDAGSQTDLFFANRDWFLGADPAARRFIRWDYPADSSGPVVATAQGCAGGGSTSEVRVLPGRLDLLVECPQASTLVLKLTYHPNWRVTVDGREQDAYMVSPSFIGVDVPAGLHHIGAEYRPQPLRLYLLLLGLLTLPLIALAEWRRAAYR